MIYYFDNAATTRVDEETGKIVQEYNERFFYNPSANYKKAVEIHNLISDARKNVLSQLQGFNGKLIFLSSGTEGDNQAIFCSKKRKNGNIVISGAEHPAVYNAAMQLKNTGYDVRIAPVDGEGRVIESEFLSLLDSNTSLVSVMHVNNETGAVNDIKTLVKKAKSVNPNILFHSDGVQAVGKVPVRLVDLDVDLYTISGHKIGTPKGIAALYVKTGVSIAPLIFGGGQEFGMRSATENVSGIIAFSNCVSRAVQEREINAQKYLNFRSILQAELSEIEEIRWISGQDASPHILTFAFRTVRGEVLQHALEEFDLLVGTGSACSARRAHDRIPQALGLKEYSDGVIRVSFGRENTEDEVKFLAKKIKESYYILRKYVGR